MDFAHFSFKIYIDTYSASEDRSITSANSTNPNSTSSDSSSDSTTTASTSIFDTYSEYFSTQSYKVTVIVIGFVIAIFGWMIMLLVIGCIYRHYLEIRWSP